MLGADIAYGIALPGGRKKPIKVAGYDWNNSCCSSWDTLRCKLICRKEPWQVEGLGNKCIVFAEFWHMSKNKGEILKGMLTISFSLAACILALTNGEACVVLYSQGKWCYAAPWGKDSPRHLSSGSRNQGSQCPHSPKQLQCGYRVISKWFNLNQDLALSITSQVQSPVNSTIHYPKPVSSDRFFSNRREDAASKIPETNFMFQRDY